MAGKLKRFFIPLVLFGALAIAGLVGFTVIRFSSTLKYQEAHFQVWVPPNAHGMPWIFDQGFTTGSYPWSGTVSMKAYGAQKFDQAFVGISFGDVRHLGITTRPDGTTSVLIAKEQIQSPLSKGFFQNVSMTQIDPKTGSVVIAYERNTFNKFVPILFLQCLAIGAWYFLIAHFARLLSRRMAKGTS
jgi:hypothetical protein